MSAPQTITFLGASTGCGLSALKQSLAAGHTCIALCRVPSKFTSKFPTEKYPNLRVVEGNAHDASVVGQCLVRPDDPSRLVDAVLFSIGGAFQMAKMTIDDPHVCERGMATLLQSLRDTRAGGASGRPLVVALSTTGISKLGCDVPLLMAPLYHLILKVPHKDKRIMEDKLTASGEQFVLVRPSLLVDGETDKDIRVGVEDLSAGAVPGDSAKLEKKELGYTISREDTGRWIFENLLVKGEYRGKAVSITW